MATSDLPGLVPGANEALYRLLDPTLGRVQAPIRAEIFGPDRFARHGRSLGESHRSTRTSRRGATFVPRVQNNIRMLRDAHRYIGAQASSGYDVSPAAEWLLDNFHLIEAQLRQIRDGLPRSYFRALPVLTDEPLVGLPRIYGVAWAFVAHTDGAFDDDLLVRFLGAYQETCELSLAEMWALPTTLRVVLIENLRRLAERVATHKAARELANLCCDRMEACSLPMLRQLLTLLERRGVGRMFLGQVAVRLRDRATQASAEQHDWLRQELPDPAAMQAQQGVDQTADNLSVSNAVTSLRDVGDADWSDIVTRTSVLMHQMMAWPLFEAEHTSTRDETLHGIEALALRSGRSEVDVAQALLGLMRQGQANAHVRPVPSAANAASAAMGADAGLPQGPADAADPGLAHHWLFGPGRPVLRHALGLHGVGPLAAAAALRWLTLPAYLGVLVLASLLGVYGLLLHQPAALPGWGPAAPWWTALAALLLWFPVSEAVVAVVNRLVSESVRPQHLPRLALAGGIGPEHQVMVVIPGMLVHARSVRELTQRLQLHYLANPERHAQFALLTDWADAPTAHLASDEGLLATARRRIHRLNLRYPWPPEDAHRAPRFILLHRPRRFSHSEQCWIGWERKRGKLELLISCLAASTSGPSTATAVLAGTADAGSPAEPGPGFIDLGDESRLAAGTRHVLTLDSDTQLPPGRLRELVGVAAHPRNQPRLDAARRSVVAGYGILQPRVATPLPAARDITLYHRLFAGQCGVDPYSAASSEVYQDLFGEGTFTGKGLLNVQAVHAVLGGRLPDEQVLSHDLLEGALVRCAAVTDLTVLEDAPFHADVAASRVHRWTRGDWQLLPLLLGRRGYRLRVINRWKMIDNLRRSLVAPMSLALLLLALAGVGVSPWLALAVVWLAFSAGALMGAVAGFSPSRDDVALQHFYSQAGADLWRAVCGGAWHLAQLLQTSLRAVDAVTRALYRMLISHRLLLQWTTAAAAQAQARTALPALLRQHRVAPLCALALLALGLLAGSPQPVLMVLVCSVWAASPLWTWWVSRTPPQALGPALVAAEQLELQHIARDTWRFFERCVGPADNHLPPDNLQTLPHDMLAHRTSPTNIGLYLLSLACARQFGWIGTQDLLARAEATLATLVRLQRHRGHFLNWYDTQTCAPLLPMYVSSVDSGNLCGHLLATAQACLELAHAPLQPEASQSALRASRQRIDALMQGQPRWWREDSAIAHLLASADASASGSGLDEVPQTPPADLLRAAQAELQAWLPEPSAAAGTAAVAEPADAAESAEPADRAERPAGAHRIEPNPNPDPDPSTRRDQLAWAVADHLATLASAAHDAAAEAAAAAQRLRALAKSLADLAWQADYSFLYHRKRHLLHIGYRVAEQQLDAGFYDLLASESRLTSLLALAKGDVPVSHWAALGRPFFAVGSRAGLRSWSGSMFEYLMPSLMLDEPCGSVLHDACLAAVREQIEFGAEHGLPWGISESAYAGRDHTLAYQYAPQGAPRLALRRTPPDEWVVAPYATALAAQVAPHAALQNFAALQALGARARYGFIEALDYTVARQTGSDPFTPVSTFMAHHQGMTIVALANVLQAGVVRRWGMAEPHFEAVASLLHERAPREVSDLLTPSARPPPQSLRRRPPGLLRDVVPGTNALEPTHVLSNGRYHVSLRANGAGHSRWGAVGITRWRDDALRDQCGSFCYLRWDQQPSPVSITQHPAPDPAAHYRSVFHADRVCFDAAWPELQAHVTVWVSPEDDIEFRQIELRNLSTRTLDIELLSAFEVTLADARADEAHPAFSNLFVRAEWQPSHQALVFTRQPRLASEQGLLMAHFVAERDEQVVAVQVQTNRQRWIGRNRSVADPLADFDALPAAQAHDTAAPPLVLDTGLDPVCALAVRLRIAPLAKAQLTLATAASPHAALLRAVVDKYRQSSHVQRASLMSATLVGIRLRALRVSAANFAALQSLTSALVMNLTRPQPAPAAGANVPAGNSADRATDDATDEAAGIATPARPGAVANLDRRALWRLGLSGDRALIVVVAQAMQSMGVLRTLVKGLALWSWGGVACDLVVVNAEAASYQMTLQRELISLRERYLADSGLEPQGAAGSVNGLHVLRADELSQLELDTLQGLARITIHADGRPLTHHVDDWIEQHDQAMQSRHETSTVVVESAGQGLRKAAAPPLGRFVAESGAFEFEAGLASRPLRPWINVLANAQFGAHLSEAGGGYTWAGNSRLNQLTAWSNDPVCDPAAEVFLLQDRKTRQVWSVSASSQAGGAGNPVAYQVSHGQGHSVLRHRRGDLEIAVGWCVDELTAIKHVQLRVTNLGPRSRALRLVGVAEWMMGAQRSDRSSVTTALHRQRLPDAAAIGGQRSSAPGSSAKAGRRLLALLCTQSEQSAGFGGGTAFLSTVCVQAQDDGDWTCDRRECFDARGLAVLPDHFGQRSGPGLDPCAALSVSLDLAAGQSAEQVFLIGYAPSAAAARQLAATASLVTANDRLAAVQRRWDALLGATQVKTPDPLFDAMVNRWLLYQTVSCRLWAKAGFYQAGGATGFRDQLQDTLSLTWAAPAMLREQIVLCASRQFAQGDVQHWWHSPGGAGVRTHFSDDLLWLAHACVHYLRATGDVGLLEEPVPFIEGSAIPEGAEDVYDSPTVSTEQATVYEHAARAIDRSLKVGAHGLPLMGTGDWNDGMNRVGHQGRGESVWLGWFLCQLVADFTPLARARQEHDRATRWEQAALGWRVALAGQAWDGQWYLRAFFDDGQALGSHVNAEARIDLIAQAWAVLSGAASDKRQRQAMAAAQTQLMDPAAGLIRLLDPPLAKALPSAGYIQSYPPGVRENGGQYTHAGIWALMALAELVRRDAQDALNQRDQRVVQGPYDPPDAQPRQATDPGAAVDQVYRCFTWLNPAHRASHPIHGPAYGLEPYAVAGDVYSQPPRVGQGGWSWYTGAAAWLHRAAVESIFGLQQGAHTLTFTPCLPSHWPVAELTLVRGQSRLRFVLVRATADEALAAAQRGAAVTTARLLRVGEELDWRGLSGSLTFVLPLLPVDHTAAILEPQSGAAIAD